MRYMTRETSTMIVGNEILQERSNGKLRDDTAPRNGSASARHRGSAAQDAEQDVMQDEQPVGQTSEILNPFVHRLELDTTYDKLKVTT